MLKDYAKKVLRLLHIRFVGRFIVIDGELKAGFPFGMEERKTKLKDIRYYKDGKIIYALWQRCDNGKFCYSILAYSAFGYDRKWTPLELSYVPIDIKNDFSNAKKMIAKREKNKI